VTHQATDTASAALLQFVEHRSFCSKWDTADDPLARSPFVNPKRPCNCGLEYVLASLPAPAAPERTYTQRELVEACQVAFADAVSACRQGYVSMDVHAPIPAPEKPPE